MKLRVFILLLSVSFLASACVPAYANQQPDAQAVFSTPATPEPTNTPTPTPTEPPAITPEVTVTFGGMPTLSPDLALLLTQVAPFPRENCQPYWETYLPSPKLAYLAFTCGDGVMRVTNEDGSDTQSFEGKLFLESAGSRVEPFVWTEDGNYLFFSVIGEHPKPWFADGIALYRLTLSNKRLTGYLGISPTNSNWYAYSLSPDGRSLAYINQDKRPLQLSIMRVGSIEDKDSYVINRDSSLRMRAYMHAGNIHWSEDGNSIALALGTEGNDQPGQTAIAILDLIEGKTRILVEGARYFELKSWPDSDHLLIEDGVTREKLLLNIRSGVLLPVP